MWTNRCVPFIILSVARANEQAFVRFAQNPRLAKTDTNLRTGMCEFIHSGRRTRRFFPFHMQNYPRQARNILGYEEQRGFTNPSARIISANQFCESLVSPIQSVRPRAKSVLFCFTFFLSFFLFFFFSFNKPQPTISRGYFCLRASVRRRS